MIRLALALSILAGPALADERAWWGSSPDPDKNTSATLALADAPAVATVTIRNRLTAGHGDQTEALLFIPGMSASIIVEHGPGDAPDRVWVTPPEGFIAVPPVIDVPEGADAVVTIYSAEGVGA